MNLQQDNFFNACDENLVDYCDSWLEQYTRSYGDMNIRCSRNKGYQLISKVSSVRNDFGEKEYLFSLNLIDRDGDVIQNAPELTVDVNREETVKYMVMFMIKHYLDFNQTSYGKLPFTGYLKQDKISYLSDSTPSSTVLDIKDTIDSVFSSSYLSYTLQNVALNHQNFDLLNLSTLHEQAKLEDMTFVIYGNPRFIRLLNPVVNWVTRPGSTSNGVKLDYGYGIMTSGDVKVQVVSTKKVMAKYDDIAKEFSGLRIIPFPLSQEQFTFKHYKYTTHILTAQNSAYRAPDLPGGSMTNLMGVSRYTNAAVQGIQSQLKISNAEQYIQL